MRLVFTSSVLASSVLSALALSSALTLAQAPDRPRIPIPPVPNLGAPAPGSPAPSPNGPNAHGPGSGAPGARQQNDSGTRDQRAGAMSAPPQAGSADQTFLARATGCGRDEAELARLAEQKAGSQSVREFARQMVREHGQTNGALSRLTEGEAVPDQPDPERRQIRDALAGLGGPEFDIEYMRQQVQAHQRMAQLMEYEIGSGKDAQVQRFASDALPKVYAHLAMARQLLDQVSMQHPQIAAAPPRKATGMPTPQTPRATLN
jgi:putative membrane protein